MWHWNENGFEASIFYLTDHIRRRQNKLLTTTAYYYFRIFFFSFPVVAQYGIVESAVFESLASNIIKNNIAQSEDYNI